MFSKANPVVVSETPLTLTSFARGLIMGAAGVLATCGAMPKPKQK
jgi:hypothetical protein